MRQVFFAKILEISCCNVLCVFFFQLMDLLFQFLHKTNMTHGQNYMKS